MAELEFEGRRGGNLVREAVEVRGADMLFDWGFLLLGDWDGFRRRVVLLFLLSFWDNSTLRLLKL